MESGESISDAVIREYREETGIYLKNPDLKGVFTFIIKDGDQIVSEWMMFSFFATEADGVNLQESEKVRSSGIDSKRSRISRWLKEIIIFWIISCTGRIRFMEHSPILLILNFILSIGSKLNKRLHVSI